MIQSPWHPPRIRFAITVAAHIAAAPLQVWQVCVYVWSCFGFWGRCALIAKAWQRLVRTGHRLGHEHGIETATSSFSVAAGIASACALLAGTGRALFLC